MKKRTILQLGFSVIGVLSIASPAFSIEPKNLKFITEKHNSKVIAVVNRHASNFASLKSSDEQTYSRKTVTQSESAADSEPVLLADNFIDAVIQSSGAFGIKSAADLSPFEIKEDSIGMKHVRYRQMAGGVPVFGGELIAHITKNNEVSSVNGRTLSKIDIDTIPSITAEDAVQAAKLAAANAADMKEFRERAFHEAKILCGGDAACVSNAKARIDGIADYSVGEKPALYVYNAGFASGAEETATSLVWHFVLVGKSDKFNVEYFVDAHSAAIVKAESTVRGINRTIYECKTNRNDGICYSNLFTVVPRSYTFGRTEGAPARGPNPMPGPYFGSVDVDTMYDLIAVLENYYKNTFNRDGGNSKGGIGDGSSGSPVTGSRAFVHVDNEGGGIGASCATSAAWFSYNSVSFCNNEITNDIAGHEYAHAVSYNMSFNPDGSRNSLVYANEPGALNESFSDVMGEMFEYSRTGTNDWVIGTNSTINHNIRNLGNPAATQGPRLYPSKFFDPNFLCVADGASGGSTTIADHAQVHVNSTVPSHAAALASQGGSFNGCTVAGIGNEKIQQIWYRALTTYYTTNETFNAAYNAHVLACQDLYSPADCEQLTKALQAVELDQNGSCGQGGVARLPDCAGSCYLSAFAAI